MNKIFNIDSPVMRFLSRVGDLIVINLLFLLCCIPVITAGASAVAMYTLTMRLVRREDRTSTIKSFFQAFAGNFKRATGIWGIFLAVGLVLAVNYWLKVMNPEAYPFVMRALLFILVLVYSVSLTWVFPLHARFENKVLVTVKNSLIIGLTYPLVTIPTVALTILPEIFLYYKTAFFLKTGIFWLFIGFALCAFLNSLLFVRVFEQFEYHS